MFIWKIIEKKILMILMLKNIISGNEVSAHKSVPTAIYSFLRGIKPFKDYFEVRMVAFLFN